MRLLMDNKQFIHTPKTVHLPRTLGKRRRLDNKFFRYYLRSSKPLLNAQPIPRKPSNSPSGGVLSGDGPSLRGLTAPRRPPRGPHRRKSQARIVRTRLKSRQVTKGKWKLKLPRVKWMSPGRRPSQPLPNPDQSANPTKVMATPVRNSPLPKSFIVRRNLRRPAIPGSPTPAGTG